MISDQKKVVVFSGANGPQEYLTMAYDVGKSIGEHGFTAITGGGPGMMREVNRGAFAVHAQSWGICIEHRAEEIKLDYFTYHEIHSKFDERNDRLLNLGDAFVVLPGGLGTIVEALQITQRKKFSEISPETPLLFVGEFYRKLTDSFDEMKQVGFISDDLSHLYHYVSTPQEMLDRLLSFFNGKQPA